MFSGLLPRNAVRRSTVGLTEWTLTIECERLTVDMSELSDGIMLSVRAIRLTPKRHRLYDAPPSGEGEEQRGGGIGSSSSDERRCWWRRVMEETRADDTNDSGGEKRLAGRQIMIVY